MNYLPNSVGTWVHTSEKLYNSAKAMWPICIRFMSIAMMILPFIQHESTTSHLNEVVSCVYSRAGRLMRNHHETFDPARPATVTRVFATSRLSKRRPISSDWERSGNARLWRTYFGIARSSHHTRSGAPFVANGAVYLLRRPHADIRVSGERMGTPWGCCCTLCANITRDYNCHGGVKKTTSLSILGLQRIQHQLYHITHQLEGWLLTTHLIKCKIKTKKKVPTTLCQRNINMAPHNLQQKSPQHQPHHQTQQSQRYWSLKHHYHRT
jgi:hypothetical protein